MESAVIHYKNKYPNAHIIESGDSIDVYCRGGFHRVALRKNGAGQWVCQSEQHGCIDRHDLSPIPKDARVHKLFAGGRRGMDEKAEERKKSRKALEVNGKVPSVVELQAAGWDIDRDGKVLAAPKGPVTPLAPAKPDPSVSPVGSAGDVNPSPTFP